MTKDEVIKKYVIPACERVWNERICKLIEQTLEWDNEEDYKQGYEDGYGLGIKVIAKGDDYKSGLNDAWECARKILFDPTLPKELTEVLGTDTFCGIIEKYSASEAIQRIKEYEEQQDYKHRVTKKSIIKSHIEDMLENYTLDEIAEVLEWMKGDTE